MIRFLQAEDIAALIQAVSLESFFLALIEQLKKDFGRWDEFAKSARVAAHFPQGVIELMPIHDKERYSFKYVNGHPLNPKTGKQTVIAFGVLAEAESGYPLLLAEMTLLTALRTAATSALASSYLAKKGISSCGIIGTGAQSEFQVLAHAFSLGIKDVLYFDIDPKAMDKFEKNLAPFSLRLHRMQSGHEVAEKTDLVTTATAAKGRATILSADWIRPGVHINGIGGDCPGKTELDGSLLDKAKVVVEYFPQTEEEGEIQGRGKSVVYAELHELVSGKREGRENSSEITLFDSVGFALEDYSALSLVYALAEKHGIGERISLFPNPQDPKDLFSSLHKY